MKISSTVKVGGLLEAIEIAVNSGLSPEQIAIASDMSVSSIYKLINESQRVRLSTVARIAEAIGYDFERIGDDVKLWKKQEREPSQALSPSALEIIQLMEQLTDKQREQFIALVRGIWRTVKDGALGTY